VDRRTFLAGAVGSVAAPVGAEAQPAGKVHRIGALGAGEPDLLRQALREAGYVEGQNVTIEWRNPEGKPERYDALAAELVRLKVDVLVASNPAATMAAKKATASIPIVMVHTPDPVQLGLVASLGRPGGNITGTTSLSTDLSVKQLELLKEAIPQAARIAVLWNPVNPWHRLALKEAEGAARSLAVQLHNVGVRAPEELEAAFAAMTKERTDAVLVLSDPMTFFHRARIADLAVRRGLPTMHGVRGYVDAGGLMSYWAYQADLYRRAASYVDRILRGAKPGDLPIEQPTRFELVINLKTAKVLGLTIPPAVLARADEIIQ
jgi:putative ABC transport system substrate-binding protein